MASGKAKKGLTLVEVFGLLERNPALKAANPHLGSGQKPPGIAQNGGKLAVLPPSEGQDSAPATPKPRKRGKKRREMNATEREFSLMLDMRVKNGVLDTFNYESITLRWGEGASMMTYTPDFVGVCGAGIDGGKPFLRLTFFEVKGAHAWKQDIVKFKAARNEFTAFEFQLWEKDKNGWHNTI